MKILVLTNLYPPHSVGGYEERCRQVCDGLRERGHEVRVLTSTHGVDTPTDQAGIHRALHLNGYLGRPWRGVIRLQPIERANNSIVQSEVRSFQPDVVHVFNLGGIGKSVLLTLQSLGVPTVFDISDHWLARSLRADVWLRWWNEEAGGAPARLLRKAARSTGVSERIHSQAPFAHWKTLRFDNAYFCSEFLRGATMRAGWDVSRAEILHCPVDVNRVRLRTRGSSFERLLWVGRLTDDKDPVSAVHALVDLVREGRDVTLTILGRGEAAYVKRLQEIARSGNAEDRLRITSVPAEGMPLIYAEHDALLFTSDWGEPFALTPIEAMAAGLPVIGTPDGGSAELLRHEHNALVVPPRNPPALAEAVRRLADDIGLRRKISAAGTAHVHMHHRLENYCAAVEALLTRAVCHA